MRPDVRICDLSDLSTRALGDYLSKVGREVRSSFAKKAGTARSCMFGLLREVIGTYEVQAFVTLERAIGAPSTASGWGS